MPHSSSINWRSQIAGKPVEYSRPTSVEDLKARRRNGQLPFEELNVDLRETGELHAHVVMRPEGGRSWPTAEIYVPKGEGPFPRRRGCSRRGDQDALLAHTFSMAKALSLVEVPITVSVVQGADHEFLKIPDVVEGSGPERERIAAWLHRQMKAST